MSKSKNTLLAKFLITILVVNIAHAIGANSKPTVDPSPGKGIKDFDWLNATIGVNTKDYFRRGENITDDILSGGGVTDHGELTGMEDDDHPQYLLGDGSEAWINASTGIDAPEYYRAGLNYTEWIESIIPTNGGGTYSGLIFPEVIVYLNGTDTQARNGTDGSLLYTHDDPTKILLWASGNQSALGGGLIAVKAGNFTLDSRLELIGLKDVTIRGAGIGATIFTVNHEAEPYIYGSSIGLINCTNVWLEHFTLDGKSGLRSGDTMRGIGFKQLTSYSGAYRVEVFDTKGNAMGIGGDGGHCAASPTYYRYGHTPLRPHHNEFRECWVHDIAFSVPGVAGEGNCYGITDAYKNRIIDCVADNPAPTQNAVDYYWNSWNNTIDGLIITNADHGITYERDKYGSHYHNVARNIQMYNVSTGVMIALWNYDVGIDPVSEIKWCKFEDIYMVGRHGFNKSKTGIRVAGHSSGLIAFNEFIDITIINFGNWTQGSTSTYPIKMYGNPMIQNSFIELTIDRCWTGPYLAGSDTIYERNKHSYVGGSTAIWVPRMVLKDCSWYYSRGVSPHGQNLTISGCTFKYKHPKHQTNNDDAIVGTGKHYTTVEDCLFQGAGSVNFSGDNNIVRNSRFLDMNMNDNIGIVISSASQGNDIYLNDFSQDMLPNPITRYAGGTYTIFRNKGLVSENRGSSTIDSSTSTTFDHGLAATPTYVAASFNVTGYGDWSWTATSTQITVTVTTSGTYEVYWSTAFDP